MISIVIPTYNRADILGECLERLACQRGYDDGFEVVIVNDGSTDNTSSAVKRFRELHPGLSVRYFEKSNEGQGIARNFGVREAQGSIIIFIGDDILVEADFVARHEAFHKKHVDDNIGLLGHIEWDERIPKDPLHAFLTNGSLILGRYGGHQFAFEKLSGKNEADFSFFYTSNISLKRAILLKFPFDESFLKYGWEDIELGYRLEKEAGFRLLYDRDIVGFHYHPMNEETLKKRMFAIGKSVVFFDRKYPELNKIPYGIKRVLFSLLGSTPTIFLFDLLRKIFGGDFYYWYYYVLSKRYFLQGLHDGIKSL